MLIEGVAQRFVQAVKGPMAFLQTSLGSLRVAQTEGEGDEMTRAGQRFVITATGATGQAPVQAIPSTTAQWFFYNPQGGIATAFLDWLAMVNLSGTAGSGEAVFACMCPPAFIPSTVPTISLASTQLMNASPASAKSSKLILTSNQTLQNAAVGNWFPIAVGAAKDGVVAVPPVGMGVVQNLDIRGKICIPPLCGLALAVIAPTGTSPTYAPVIGWHEYLADLE